MAEAKKTSTAETKKPEENKSVFDVLYAVSVSDKKETKNGLSYLSWAWAWAEAKKRYPDINYKVYEDEHGCMYHTDGRTCWVKCGVTINGVEQIEYLGIMDYKNQSIPLAKVNSTDAVKAVQRCVTKAIGRFGLGLYIYAGEDLPEDMTPSDDEAAVETANKSQKKASDDVVCSKCGKPITDCGNYKAKAIIQESTKKLGKATCLPCWQAMADAKRKAQEAKMDGEAQALQHEDAGDRI